MTCPDKVFLQEIISFQSLLLIRPITTYFSLPGDLSLTPLYSIGSGGALNSNCWSSLPRDGGIC